MKTSTTRRTAWALGLVSIALMIAGLALMYIDRNAPVPTNPFNSADWNFSNVLNVAVNMMVPVLGIVLASRRPENPIGWLFLVAGVTLGVSGFGTAYGVHALVADPGSLPFGRALTWLSNWIGLLPLSMLAFLFLLFPTGHLRSSRWRPAAWVIGVCFTITATTALVFATQSWSDPFNQQPGGNALVFLLFAGPVFVGTAIAVTAVVMRFRGSVGDERLQMKWFATGAVLVFITLLSTIASTAPIFSVLQSLAFIFVYVAIGIAVLRYRLYEIDVVINKTVVYGVLAAFFTIVYLAVVVGIGTAIGSTQNPFLTVLAAVLIALAFNPVRVRATRLANRIVYGRRASPYEVLSEFSDRMAGTYSVEDVLPQMAGILGEGTGGRQAGVWLRVGGELRLEAVWGEAGEVAEHLPVTDDQMPVIAGASKVVAVRHRDELLGALTVTKPPNEPLSVAEDKLMSDLASQAGLVLRNVRLTEELRANLRELRASRQRLVAAQDQERRRIERNIHDGAQQQLVALAVKANLAGALVGKDPDKERTIIDQLRVEAQDALETLRDLARGIYPPLLADQGLSAALEAQARKSAVPVMVEGDRVGRYPQEVEAAVYFCCLEALQNMSKYSGARSARVHLSSSNGHLSFEVTDDGVGFDPASTRYGTGLQGMADRLDALGGAMKITSLPGSGTTVSGIIPTAG